MSRVIGVQNEINISLETISCCTATKLSLNVIAVKKELIFFKKLYIYIKNTSSQKRDIQPDISGHIASHIMLLVIDYIAMYNWLYSQHLHNPYVWQIHICFIRAIQHREGYIAFGYITMYGTLYTWLYSQQLYSSSTPIYFTQHYIAMYVWLYSQEPYNSYIVYWSLLCKMSQDISMCCMALHGYKTRIGLITSRQKHIQLASFMKCLVKNKKIWNNLIFLLTYQYCRIFSGCIKKLDLKTGGRQH